MVYVFLADGFEIIEALSPVDMLKRAKIETKLVGVTGEIVTSSCGVAVKTDMLIDDFDFYDVEAIVLPGGMPGAENLDNCKALQGIIDNASNTNSYICAICAAPFILGKKGLLNGKSAICYPGFEVDLQGANIAESAVCRDGNCITAKGMGVAVDFGLEITAALLNRETADNIRKSIQCV